MKKVTFKTILATVCIVVVGFSSFKTYNVANQSNTDMLLAQNVEALSQNESNNWKEWFGKGEDRAAEYAVDIICKYYCPGNKCNPIITIYSNGKPKKHYEKYRLDKTDDPHLAKERE